MNYSLRKLDRSSKPRSNHCSEAICSWWCMNCMFFVLHWRPWGFLLSHIFYLRKKVHHGSAAQSCTCLFGKSLTTFDPGNKKQCALLKEVAYFCLCPFSASEMNIAFLAWFPGLWAEGWGFSIILSQPCHHGSLWRLGSSCLSIYALICGFSLSQLHHNAFWLCQTFPAYQFYSV